MIIESGASSLKLEWNSFMVQERKMVWTFDIELNGTKRQILPCFQTLEPMNLLPEALGLSMQRSRFDSVFMETLSYC